MAKYKLTIDDLRVHLSEQLGSLQRAAHSFDEGYRAGAKQIATILRVLLHSGRYPSLLRQLDLDTLEFVDTASALDNGNLLSTHSLIGITAHKGEWFYSAKLDDTANTTRVPFADWWRATVFIDASGREMSRADIVLTAADQDGGAHVDDALEEKYAALSRENSLGWSTNSGAALRDPELIAIRQVAHEVLKTFVPGYARTREQALALRREPEISGGKLRFFPAGEFFMKNDSKPTLKGAVYRTDVFIDSITVGSVRMVVGSTLSSPMSFPGLHTMEVVAGSEQLLGVFGSYTDAVVDRVSVVQLR